MSHTCVLGDGQEKRHEVMSHTCILVEGGWGVGGGGGGSWCKHCPVLGEDCQEVYFDSFSKTNIW